MLYQSPKTRVVPPTVKRHFQIPFSNKGLGNFGQRRAFSSVLDEKSYETPEFAHNTEGRMPEPVPTVLSRG